MASALATLEVMVTVIVLLTLLELLVRNVCRTDMARVALQVSVLSSCWYCMYESVLYESVVVNGIKVPISPDSIFSALVLHEVNSWMVKYFLIWALRL
jgi:hypothetical protein